MEEKIANAEIEVEASAARVTSNITIEKREAAKKQAAIVGHPLHLFTKENEALTEMIYKEQNILFPICTRFFTEEEWYKIYQDLKDYAPCLVDFIEWPEAEAVLTKEKPDSNAKEGMINLPGGHFTPTQLRAILNTLPVEISFVDENDINCFFNEGPKLFKRASMAIGRDVYSCHPPKIEMMVRSIIGDFKSGARDKVSVWMEKEGIPVLVEYISVRDDNGQYIGTMECVQKMDEAKKYFEK